MSNRPKHWPLLAVLVVGTSSCDDIHQYTVNGRVEDALGGGIPDVPVQCRFGYPGYRWFTVVTSTGASKALPRECWADDGGMPGPDAGCVTPPTDAGGAALAGEFTCVFDLMNLNSSAPQPVEVVANAEPLDGGVEGAAASGALVNTEYASEAIAISVPDNASVMTFFALRRKPTQ